MDHHPAGNVRRLKPIHDRGRSGSSIRSEDLRLNVPCFGDNRYGVIMFPCLGVAQFRVELVSKIMLESAKAGETYKTIREISTSEVECAIVVVGLLMALANPTAYCDDLATTATSDQTSKVIRLGATERAPA